MNNYLIDSGIFFKEVSKGIQDKITDNNIIQLSFNLALGCERLLKGILYDINPLYTLIEPDFRHSIQTQYLSKLITDSTNSKELANNPNSDVISFSNSLLKAQLISQSVHNHKNVLFIISNCRDIIAHCELKLLDKNKMKEILQRDFYIMMKSFAKELGIKQSHFFDQSHIKLSRISRSLLTDLDKQLELLLEEHKEKWQILRGNLGFISEKDMITENVYNSGNKEKIVCPSCSNISIVYLKPIIELDVQKMEETVIGYQVRKLKCQYCKLEIANPSMLDKLGINDRKIHSNKNCIYCGQEIEIGEVCDSCDVSIL